MDYPTKFYPSWCPDWTKPTYGQVLKTNSGQSIYNASRRLPAVAAFSEDDCAIYLNGFRISSITNSQFQGTDKRFSTREEEGMSCQWDIEAMLKNLNKETTATNSSPSEEHSDLVENKRLEYCHYTLTKTLLGGFYTDQVGYDREIPPFEGYSEADEWWYKDQKKIFMYEAGQRTMDRTVIFCDDKRLGLAPKRAKEKDEVWIFIGASTPFVIRNMNQKDGDKEAYKFIGNAYVDGVMKGEIMDDLDNGVYELKTIALR